MKNSKNTLTLEEKKAKKAAAAKALREKRKAEKIALQNEMNALPEKFEKAFDFPVRIYKNLRLEKTNSYRASAGSLLKFEKIKESNNITVFRVRRTGRRTFFTTHLELVAPKEEVPQG
jgi:hypothetical protein